MKKTRYSSDVYAIDSVDELNKLARQITLNTFVSVLDSLQLSIPEQYNMIATNFYMVVFKPVDEDDCDCCGKCDFREMSVSF